METGEKRTLVTLRRDLLEFAENQKMERAKREKALLETLRSTEKNEHAWKAEIEAWLQAVQPAVNRKVPDGSLRRRARLRCVTTR